MENNKDIRAFYKLYRDLEYQFNNEIILGHESWDDVKNVAGKVARAGSQVFNKLKSMTTKLLAILNPFIKKLLKRYDLLMDLWEERLEDNMSSISQDKFDRHVLMIVPKEQLRKRMEAVTKIHAILNNITKVVKDPIDNNKGWRTQGLDEAYMGLLDIGFSLSKYNLMKKVDKEYDRVRVKQTIEEHGYSLNDLQNLIRSCNTIARYLTPEYTKNLSKIYTENANYLMSKESMIMDLDGEDKSKLLNDIEIRTARLWWISHFMKISFIIANDIIVDILRLCKTAEKYAESPEEI